MLAGAARGETGSKDGGTSLDNMRLHFFLLMQQSCLSFECSMSKVLFDNAIHGSQCNTHYLSHDFLFSDNISVSS